MNGGKYKVAVDSELCDIHFFAKLYSKSAASWLFSEHEGRNSVSNKGAEQVMLYCPCGVCSLAKAICQKSCLSSMHTTTI